MTQDPTAGKKPVFVLKLYVVGDSPLSSRAQANLRRFCEAELFGRYELQIVDVLDDPLCILRDGITATPMLLKIAPDPSLRILGDLADKNALMALLATS